MSKNTRFLTHAAVIAALYAVLTHLQNVLLPGSTTWAIQMRLSEALCVLSFFTPAAIPGLTVGCLVFNITYAAALPLDFLVGSLATLLAAGGDVADPAGHGEGLSSGGDGDARTVQRTAGRLGN